MAAKVPVSIPCDTTEHRIGTFETYPIKSTVPLGSKSATGDWKVSHWPLKVTRWWMSASKTLQRFVAYGFVRCVCSMWHNLWHLSASQAPPPPSKLRGRRILLKNWKINCCGKFIFFGSLWVSVIRFSWHSRTTILEGTTDYFWFARIGQACSSSCKLTDL